MPVTIRLFDLVQVPDTRHLWPEQFRGLMESIEEQPTERSNWGAAADWLEENDEDDLAFGFRYVYKRPELVLYKSISGTLDDGVWTFSSGLTNALYKLMNKFYHPSVAGLVAILVKRINDVKKELE